MTEKNHFKKKMLFSHNYSFERKIGDDMGTLGFDRRITMTNADGGKTEYYFDATNQRSWKVNPEDWTSDNSNPAVPKTYSAIDPDPNNKARIGDTWNADDEETKIDYDPVTGLPLVITAFDSTFETYEYLADTSFVSMEAITSCHAPNCSLFHVSMQRLFDLSI